MQNTDISFQSILFKTDSSFYCTLTLRTATFLKLLCPPILQRSLLRQGTCFMLTNRSLGETRTWSSHLNQSLLKSFCYIWWILHQDLGIQLVLTVRKHFPLLPETPELFGTQKKIHCRRKLAQWVAKLNNVPVYRTSYVGNISVFISGYLKFCPFGCKSYLPSKF